MTKLLRKNHNTADIIRYPIITNKSMKLLENNQYSFIVDPSSTKINIKKVIEDLFNVKIIKINTCHLPKKKKCIGKNIGYKSHYKKATVKLKKGDKINFFLSN